MGLWDNYPQSGETPKPVYEPVDLGAASQSGSIPVSKPADMWNTGDPQQDCPAQPCISNIPIIPSNPSSGACPIKLDMTCVLYHFNNPVASNLLGCLTPAGTPPFSLEAVIERTALLITENVCNPTVLSCYRLINPTLPEIPTINELVMSLQEIICSGGGAGGCCGLDEVLNTGNVAVGREMFLQAVDSSPVFTVNTNTQPGILLNRGIPGALEQAWYNYFGMVLYNAAGFFTALYAPEVPLTMNQQISLPNLGANIAITMPASVNGVYADQSGNIVISSGGATMRFGVEDVLAGEARFFDYNGNLFYHVNAFADFVSAALTGSPSASPTVYGNISINSNAGPSMGLFDSTDGRNIAIRFTQDDVGMETTAINPVTLDTIRFHHAAHFYEMTADHSEFLGVPIGGIIQNYLRFRADGLLLSSGMSSLSLLSSIQITYLGIIVPLIDDPAPVYVVTEDSSNILHRTPVSFFGGGGGITGSGAIGQVAFWDSPSTLTGENNLFWDAANNRLGIGTTVPDYSLHIATTAPQLKIGPDATNHLIIQVLSTGNTTITAAGSAPAITFIPTVYFPFGMATSVSTTPTGGNLWIPAALGSGTTTNTQHLFGGAATVAFRIAQRGSSAALPAAGIPYASTLVGQQVVNIASSGTHSLFAQQVIKPLSITATAGTGILANSATLYLEGAATGATVNYNLWIAGLNLSRIDSKLTLGGVLNTDGVCFGRINSHSDSGLNGLYVKAYNSSYATRIEGDIASNTNTGLYINKCTPAIRIENSTLGLYYYSVVYPQTFVPAVETSWAIELYVSPPAYGVDAPTLNHAALKIREYTPNYAVSIGSLTGLNLEVLYQGIDTITIGGARVQLRNMYGLNLAMGTNNGTDGATPGFVTNAYFIYMPAGPLMDDSFYYTNVWGIYSATTRAMHYLNSKVGIKTLPTYASAFDLDVNGTARVSGSLTGVTEAPTENSTKLASTAWVNIARYAVTQLIASSYTTQTIAIGGTPQKITIENLERAVNMSISSSTVTIVETGNYIINICCQLHLSSGSNDVINIFFKRNGTNVPNSNSRFGVPSTNNDTNMPVIMPISLTAGDTLEAWMQGNTTGLGLEYLPATATLPATTSLLLYITRVG